MRLIRGRQASPGLAYGKAFVLKRRRPQDSVSDVPAERERLRAAIAAAVAQLHALAAKAPSRDARGMLEFQAELAKDPSLVDSAYAKIEQGQGAVNAWRMVLDAEVAEYQQSSSDSFRARASDVADLRERVLDIMLGRSALTLPAGRVVLADDMTPSMFLSTDWRRGALVLEEGSASSHVAMLARSQKVPMLIDAKWREQFADQLCIVDAEEGVLQVEPDEKSLANYRRRRQWLARQERQQRDGMLRPARTACGQALSVRANITSLDELAGMDRRAIDGLGLVRTEFLFKHGLADEESQYQSYRKLLKWAGRQPVTIRTLDAGGDKPIPGYTVDGESSPFLGTRGLRLSLRHSREFRTQLRALLRAAQGSKLRILLPMVTVPSEYSRARRVLREEAAKLKVPLPPLGMMVEVPAAALAIEKFRADFYAIGSNDLLQYLTACGRDVAGLDELAEQSMELLLELIARVVAHGKSSDAEVSICGDLAGDPARIPALLACGLRSLSMAYSRVGAAKAAIAKWRQMPNQ